MASQDHTDVLHDVFQVLYEAWVEGQQSPKRFVGLQGDNIVILTPGKEPAGLVIYPVTIGVPS